MIVHLFEKDRVAMNDLYEYSTSRLRKLDIAVRFVSRQDPRWNLRRNSTAARSFLLFATSWSFSRILPRGIL